MRAQFESNLNMMRVWTNLLTAECDKLDEHVVILEAKQIVIDAQAGAEPDMAVKKVSGGQYSTIAGAC